jgi:predicted PurR-regulated permease PerM
VVVYVGLTLAGLGGLALLASPFVQQATGLLDELPRLADAAKEHAPAIDARARQMGLPLSVHDVQTRAAALVVDSGSAVLGAVPALLLALFFQPFPTVLWVGLYFVAIQQIESNVLAPRITGHAVGLHPLAALLALVAGLELAGVLGGLFVVPVVGVASVLVGSVYRRVSYGAAEPPLVRRGWRITPRRGPRATTGLADR